MFKPLLIAILLLALAAGVVAKQFIVPGEAEAAPVELTAGSLIVNPRGLEPFELMDHRGGTFSQQSLEGSWTLMSFGYSHCPDMCPTTLTSLASINGALTEEQKSHLQIVFVFVDWERDQPERLQEYLPFFDKTFTGATGPEEATEKLTTQLGVLWQRAEGGDDENYLVDHSGTTYLFGPDGRLRALFGYPLTPADVVSDLEQLLDG
ncbi:MAG: SCO family protein [Lysobacterales bacterium]|jgi:protein SCO1/2